jgi:hypothetical protein
MSSELTTVASQSPSSGFLLHSDDHRRPDEERRSVVGSSGDNAVRMVGAPSRIQSTLSYVSDIVPRGSTLTNEGLASGKDNILLPKPSDAVVLGRSMSSSTVLDRHPAERAGYHVLDSHQSKTNNELSIVSGCTSIDTSLEAPKRKISPMSTSSLSPHIRLITRPMPPALSFPALPSRIGSSSIEKNCTVVLDITVPSTHSGKPTNTPKQLRIIDYDDMTQQQTIITTGPVTVASKDHGGSRKSNQSKKVVTSSISHVTERRIPSLISGPIATTTTTASAGRLQQRKRRPDKKASPSTAYLTFQEMTIATDCTSSSSSQRKRRRCPSSARTLQTTTTTTHYPPTIECGIDHQAKMTMMATATTQQPYVQQRRESVPLDVRNKKMRPTDCLLFAASLLEERETILHSVPPELKTPFVSSSDVSETLSTPATTTTMADDNCHTNDHENTGLPSCVQVPSRIENRYELQAYAVESTPTAKSVDNPFPLSQDVLSSTSSSLLLTPSNDSSKQDFVLEFGRITAATAAGGRGDTCTVDEIETQTMSTTTTTTTSATTITTTSKPRDVDVLCGRGGSVNKHKGNIVYRKVVDYNKAFYQSVHKKHRILVSRSIVQSIINYGGRFLVMGNSGSSSSSSPKGGTTATTTTKKVWVPICFKRAVQKTSQALRERSTATTDGGSGGGGVVDNNNMSCGEDGVGKDEIDDHESASSSS